MKDKSSISRRAFLGSTGLIGGMLSTRVAGERRRGSAHLDPMAVAAEEDITRRLARYVVEARPSDIPAAPRQEAVRTIVNYVGCAVGGSNHETVNRALAALNEISGPRQASVLGRRDRLDILHAALVNGISSHVLDFDDTDLETIIHPGGPVASALLALSERQPVSGEDFLRALVLGVEVECRIGRAVYPSHYDVGWHITGTAGVFGGAAAAGKLLGLSEQRMVWALGTAATQSSGFREMFGTMSKPFHVGRAAQNGMLAALLASKDFTSSERGIEAPRSFAYVMAPERDLSVITEGLGKTFEISRNTYKPFACGIVIHPVIDACIQLRNEHGLQADQIERIDLRVNPLVLELTGKKTPASGLEGKFSVYHSASVALIYGAAGPREYTDPVVRDPGVVALRDRVTANADPNVREEEAFAVIALKDGRRLEKHVEHAVGSLERPMSDSDLEAKFRSLAKDVLSAKQTDQLLSLCWSIASLKDAGEIARASVPM